ncbi:MAG TPA: DUF2905 domain-containing protein [Gemmatimonadaceae bacterium]|nr:DUF2905 domain-containing protein [Gemmatimonadaceae bacterium]
MDSRAGVFFVGLGIVAVLVGLAMMRGWLGWFGHLPGDIRVERENMRLYVPLVSMLLISVLFSVLSYVLRRFF